MRTPARSAVLITATEPEPRSFGKQVVIGGLLDHLCDRLGPRNVHVVLIGNERERPATPYALTVIPRPRATEQVRALVGRVGLPPHSSLQEAALWSPRVLADLDRTLASIGADLEIWDTMRTGQYARRLPRRHRVLYADDLFSKRYATMLRRMAEDPSKVDNPLGEFAKMLPGIAVKVAERPAMTRLLLRTEEHLVHRSEDRAPALFDATVLVNPEETEELRRRTGNPSIHTLAPLLPEPSHRVRRFDGSSTFVFLGSLDFPPNRDGLTWFLRECREPVLAAVPDFRLRLVGRGADNPPPEAAAWGEHVAPLGWVDDLDDVLLSVAALLSPLRIGSGTKIKVLEALGRGLPVVATPAGVLGLGVHRVDGCLLGDTPDELARHLAEVIDPGVNRALSAAAAQRWWRSFAPEVVATAYDEVLGLEPQAARAGR